MYEARLRETLPRVQERIAQAVARSGRKTDVTLVAVTKGHPVGAVQAALALGHRDCGENRVQELEEKVGLVGREAVRWHLIGHLQRNKVKLALPLFDLIHSIDSVRLAQELSKEAVKAGATVRGLAQVNVSGEETKGGFEGSDSLAAAIAEIAQVVELPGLEVVGLMTMAPLTDDEQVLRTTFRRARELFDRCGQELQSFEPRHLSMGMSNDFELAVEEGSTMVRLGTTLFGERQR